jgi:hypothetical protein
MCAGCFTHLLADARLRDEIATCPNCRVEISKHIASRNLAVEKAVNELPAECQYCNKEFPRNSLEHHEKELCEERYPIMFYKVFLMCNSTVIGFSLFSILSIEHQRASFIESAVRGVDHFMSSISTRRTVYILRKLEQR